MLEAQQCLPTNKDKDSFGAAYRVVNRAWNALSPDAFLIPYKADYIWLTKIYESIKPVDSRGPLIWASVGPKTLELISGYITVDDIDQVDEADIIELDADLVEDFVNGKKSAQKKVKKLEIDLIAKIRKHSKDKRFIALGEKLENLKEQYDAGLCNSVGFLKMLLQLAKQDCSYDRIIWNCIN